MEVFTQILPCHITAGGMQIGHYHVKSIEGNTKKEKHGRNNQTSFTE